jgi:hypothetical protein
MKKIILFLLLLCPVVSSVYAQQVEKNLWSVQAGFPGILINNESRLSEQVALRSEICFTGSYWQSSSSFTGNNSGYAVAPIFSVEPRWYYNLQHRAKKGKRTEFNSANYLSLKTSLVPGLTILSRNTTVYQALGFIPTWGITRSLGNRFTFETSVGAGYMFSQETDNYFTIELTLRFGYVVAR